MARRYGGYGGYPVLRAQENLTRTLRGMGDIGDAKYKAGLLDLETAKTEHALDLGALQKQSLQRKGKLEEFALQEAQRKDDTLNKRFELSALLQKSAGPLRAGHLVKNVLPGIANQLGWKFSKEGGFTNEKGEPLTYRDAQQHAEFIQGVALAKTDIDEHFEDVISEFETGSGGTQEEHDQAKRLLKEFKKDPTVFWDNKTKRLMELRGTFLDRGYSTKTLDTQLGILEKKKADWIATQTKKADRAHKEKIEQMKITATKEGKLPPRVKAAQDTVKTLIGAKYKKGTEDYDAMIAAMSDDPVEAAKTLREGQGSQKLSKSELALLNTAMTEMSDYFSGGSKKEPTQKIPISKKDLKVKYEALKNEHGAEKASKMLRAKYVFGPDVDRLMRLERPGMGAGI